MGGGRADLEGAALPESFVDLGPELTDFAETAAAMTALDLIISPCTSTTHLAGALGRPLWVMLASAADWRWFRDRDDSPWYPTARLFRQSVAGDWTDPVARMRAALDDLVRARSG
jgi:ADP-heptose:LPS heptosyltransferase